MHRRGSVTPSREGSLARMRTVPVLALVVLCGCGVSKEEYDAKVQEADGAKAQVGQLQQQLAADETQISQLKGAVGMAQSKAMTDDQKAQLEEAKRAMQE